MTIWWSKYLKICYLFVLLPNLISSCVYCSKVYTSWLSLTSRENGLETLFMVLNPRKFPEYSRAPCFPYLNSRSLTLESHISKLKHLGLCKGRILFRDSGLNCQLTFESFCAEILELYLLRVGTFKEGWFSLSFPICSLLFLYSSTFIFSLLFFFISF